MVSYGPWVQEPDWEYLDLYEPGEEDPRVHSTGSVMVEAIGPWVHIDDGAPLLIKWSDIVDLLDQAKDAAVDKFGSIRYSWQYVLSYPYWQSRIFATVSDSYYDVGIPPGGFPFGEGVADPEDAIGVQYQGFPWNPDDPWSSDLDVILGAESVEKVELVAQGALSRTWMSGDWEDEKNEDNLLTEGFKTEILCVPTGGEPTTIAAIDIAPEDVLPDPFKLDLLFDEDVDITLRLNSVDYTGGIFCRTNTLVPPYRPPDELPIENNEVRYGLTMSAMQLRWTVRALPYRWVYDSTPYRRTFPRDDGLAGGAGRTYPPSRTLQSGNRTSGYL